MPRRSRPLGSDTIILQPPTEVVDTRDNTTYWTWADGATVRNCSFQPYLLTEKFQEEFTLERESSRTFCRVFVPVNDDTLLINEQYRIVFQGEQYEVHAITGEWRAFSGRKDHIAFLVKRRD